MSEEYEREAERDRIADIYGFDDDNNPLFNNNREEI
jgi:hypothetical protein